MQRDPFEFLLSSMCFSSVSRGFLLVVFLFFRIRPAADWFQSAFEFLFPQVRQIIRIKPRIKRIRIIRDAAALLFRRDHAGVDMYLSGFRVDLADLSFGLSSGPQRVVGRNRYRGRPPPDLSCADAMTRRRFGEKNFS